MKPPKQASLFDEPPTLSPTADLLRIDQSQAALNPAQRNFNRLTEQIARARAKLELWKLTLDRVHERVLAEVPPITEALALLQRQLIAQLDALLSHPPAGLKLSRRRRDALTEFLLERIEDAVGAGEDEELEDLYQRYNGISLDELRQMDQDLELEFAQGVASTLFGDDLAADHSAESAEELFRQVQERMDERLAAEQQEREADAARRKRKRGPTAAEQRREQAAQAAGQSLREVYRKLVSSLHPDRESDLDERARKTGLMKQINKAYEAKDLLTLLTLQMEVEQINAGTLATLPEQRLLHYNQVLREQLSTLQEEIKAYAVQMEDQLGAGPREHMREPKDAERLFERQLRELRQTQTRFKSIISALSNPHLRNAEIDRIANKMYQR